MTPFYTDDSVTLYHGDCLEVLASLPDCSVDSVVTDPPYGLGFMGREWDDLPPGLEFAAECLRVLKPGGHLLAFGGSRTWHRLTCAIEDAGFEIRDSIAWLYGSGFPKSLDVSKAIDKAAGAEREVVGTRISGGMGQGRVDSELPPSGIVNGARNQFKSGQAEIDITAPATPDAQKWQGWGTALKPAFEPIVVARKPLAGTVAANVLKWGCGAINIDSCRIESDGGSDQGISGEAAARGCRVHDVRPMREADGEVAVAGQAGKMADDLRVGVSQLADARREQPQLGRRDLDGQEDGLPTGVGSEPVARGPSAVADAVAEGISGTPISNGSDSGATTGTERDGASHQRDQGRQPTGEPAPDELAGTLTAASISRAGTGEAASGERRSSGCTCASDVTPAGRWPSNVVLDESQAAELDRQSGEAGGGYGVRGRGGSTYANGQGFANTLAETGQTVGYGDSGGASRFFPTFRYEPKAPTTERPRENGTAHPTVKPLDLMRWLVRLVTPPGGTVLEPFAGSGTTAEACVVEGFKCVAVEREADYLPLIVQRLTKPIQVTLI